VPIRDVIRVAGSGALDRLSFRCSFARNATARPLPSIRREEFLPRPSPDVALRPDAHEVPRDSLGAEGGRLGGLEATRLPRSVGEARSEAEGLRARASRAQSGGGPGEAATQRKAAGRSPGRSERARVDGAKIRFSVAPLSAGPGRSGYSRIRSTSTATSSAGLSPRPTTALSIRSAICCAPSPAQEPSSAVSPPSPNAPRGLPASITPSV
jgi:hypothetical protein